jgi:pimeloyl-ACP methyl ester carboxylesterase
MPLDRTEFLGTPRGGVAFRRTEGLRTGAGLVWLGGFHSDMQGEKARALHTTSELAGRAFVRFDYSGHGESGGAFEDGTIGAWRADALAVIDGLTQGPLVLCGSSMGGWLAILAALARPDRVKGLLLLAPAPDFTDKLMWASFSEAQRREILDTGRWMRPSPYDPAGYPITRSLIEEGRRWNVLDGPISFSGPVRILQGGRDADVPPDHSRRLVDAFESKDVTWTLIKDGDHRLSRPQDLALMVRDALALADQADAA